MAHVVLQPTPEILKVRELIDQAVVGFINARFTVPQLSKWEADVEAMLLQSLAIRDIEAILELAGTDLVLLPSANVLARAVFEIALKAAWLVQPEDPYGREVRWLAHLEEDARLNEKVATKVSSFGGNGRAFQERGTTFRNFAQAVAAKLPPGYQKLPGNPSVESMLESIGQKQMYSVYSLLAAHVHGGHASTWLYRKHLGTASEYGEFITPAEWYLPLWASWSSLLFLGQYVLERLGAKAPQFISPAQGAAIDHALSSLSSKVSENAS